MEQSTVTLIRQLAAKCDRGCNIDGLRYDFDLEGMVDCKCRRTAINRDELAAMKCNQPLEYEESRLHNKMWARGRWLFRGNKQQWKRHAFPLLKELIKMDGTYKLISADRLVFAEFHEDEETSKPLMDLLSPTILIIELRAGALFKERGPLRLKNIVEERETMQKPTWVWHNDNAASLVKEFGDQFAAFMNDGWECEVF